MNKVAVVYHSGFGHTAKQAEAVAAGARGVPDTEARAISVENFEAEAAFVDAADAIIFGSPSYMGCVTGPFKTWMDATGERWFNRVWKDKLAAGFANSASQCGDKLNVLIQLAIFAAQHGMIWVGLDILPGNNSTQGSVEDLNRLGSFLGAMAQSNNDEGPELAPPPADLKTAEYLGRRVAEQVKRLK